MPKVIDLFSGVGGLSLGAARAGFKVAAAVELDPIAVKWHAINFPESRHLSLDVGTLSGEALLAQAQLARGEVDGIVGGPPCQGFSEAGKKAPGDPRNELLGHFFRLVAEIRPRFFLAENVPGVLASRNSIVLQACLDQVPADYLMLPPLIVKANEFGAATSRKRVFFIGYDPRQMDSLSAADLAPPEDVSQVTVGHALCGLPMIRSAWQAEVQSWRPVAEALQSHFFERLTGAIPLGVGDAQALSRYANKREVSGFLGTLHTPETLARFKQLKPGATDPISRSVRLSFDGLCPTLRAGTNSDRGSFQAVRPVHHKFNRVIAPREAARLQGFPDWFQFHPTKWHAFRQIGNSVSPLVAERILVKIAERLS